MPRPARAGACCGTGQNVALRLAPEERASLNVVATGADLRGHWDGDGRYVPADPQTRDRELRLEGRALFRLSRRAQVGVVLPWMQSTRATIDRRASGGGLGDLTALLRWDFVRVGGEGSLPGVGATLAIAAPTGRAPFASKDALFADVTGVGAWEARPGLALEKSWWTGWYVLGALGVGFYAPTEASVGRIQLGPRALAFLAGGKTWTNGLGIAGAVSSEREAGPRVDGARSVAYRARTSLMLFGAYALDERWGLTVSAQWEPPLERLGREQLAGFTLGVGVRRAWTVYE